MYKDDELTQEERDLIHLAETSGQTGQSIGSLVGGLGGGALGGLASIFTAGSAAVPLVSTGFGIGSSVGSALGSWLGSEQAKAATDKLNKLREQRLADETERKSKSNAIYSLLGDFINVRGV